jgi:serine/threonine-protein kinase HipA
MFLRATQAITRHAGDVAEVFRRMVFNILACNRDDHTRQHAFLMDARGEWRLSPAFDLTFSQGPGGEHYLDVAGEGRQPTRAHVLKVGAPHGFDTKRTTAVIEEVRATVAHWPKYADAAGVTVTSKARIGGVHARVWADFG